MPAIALALAVSAELRTPTLPPMPDVWVDSHSVKANCLGVYQPLAP